ncbi:MAG: LysM peptidoglycan-binding domain-containing protein [Lachnospiraceae bacterium]|nr:LysM peptidoglycan-binding domain-containing protein [Lachnospiraceae bacterium]
MNTTAQSRESRNRRAASAARKRHQTYICRFGILLATVILLFVLGVRFLGTTAQADEIPSGREKYYTSILIQPGDTLWTIAEQYVSPEYDSVQSYVNELKFMNGMTGSTIYAGNYLTIAYYR